MSIWRLRLAAAAAGLVFLCAGGKAQTGTSEIRGELRLGTESAMDFVLELDEPGRNMPPRRASVSGDGSFRISNVETGTYYLKVLNLYGEVVYRELVQTNAYAPVTIRLPQPGAVRPTGQSVSLRQLQNPPSRSAIKAIEAAHHFFNATQYDKALGKLEEAVRLSPDFADAYGNMAVLHLKLHQWADAGRAASQAIEIRGPNAFDLTNLAHAEAATGELNQAEQHVREALRLEPSSPMAHYLLGDLLATDPHRLPEALEHYRQAGQSIPAAKLTASRLQSRIAAAAN